jgi:hypothetical protein
MLQKLATGLARTRSEQEKNHGGRAMVEIAASSSETLMLKAKWRGGCTWIGRPFLVGFGEVSSQGAGFDKPLGPQSGLAAAAVALQELQKLTSVASPSMVSAP